MKRVFVAATGTDLGKTYVLRRLLVAAAREGQTVSVLKPVISGFDEAQWQSSDSAVLLSALKPDTSLDDVRSISPWRFRAALSPDVAAAREGRAVKLQEIVAFCKTASKAGEGVAFIEGAGGIMSPLGQGFTNLDLAKALDAEVLLVGGGYLGAISHILTAVEAMKARGIFASALVLSAAERGPMPLAETARVIADYCDRPIYCVERDGDVCEPLVRHFCS